MARKVPMNEVVLTLIDGVYIYVRIVNHDFWYIKFPNPIINMHNT